LILTAAPPNGLHKTARSQRNATPGKLIILFLIIATCLVYWQARHHDFIDFDDDVYVSENPHIQDGLTGKGILWAFTRPYAANWHPLTWLSHMLDIELFGLNPGWHHLISVLFHIANSLLLFFVLRRMTRDLWPSAFVAALFALHPLHVESVAWISERKDVLSTFFWMLTIGTYAQYAESPNRKNYLTVILCFILGLMSKPMLVTLPFVLLLLDFWPLGRIPRSEIRNSKSVNSPFEGGQGDVSASHQGAENPKSETGLNFRFPISGFRFSIPKRLLLEKIPLLILSAGSAVITFFAQQKGGAVRSLEMYSSDVRIGNALVSYVNYIWKMLWPSDLALLYPHPGILPLWKVAGAFLTLIFISLAALRCVRQAPYFLVGWLWYMGTLVPVIGLVQVGLQAMADRYTYVPLIGIFVIIAWGVPDMLEKWRYKKAAIAAAGSGILLIFATAAYVQTAYWSDSIKLFERALDVTENNYVCHNNLGQVLQHQGKIPEAAEHYREALRINPAHAESHNNLATALEEQGRADEAIRHYKEALRLNPRLIKTYNSLGILLDKQGRPDEAVQHYSEALRLHPNYAEAHHNMGLVLFGKGKMRAAAFHFQEVVRIRPGGAEAHNTLAVALFKIGKIGESVFHFREAIRIKPDYTEARNNLKKVGAIRKSEK